MICIMFVTSFDGTLSDDLSTYFRKVSTIRAEKTLTTRGSWKTIASSLKLVIGEID